MFVPFSAHVVSYRDASSPIHPLSMHDKRYIEGKSSTSPIPDNHTPQTINKSDHCTRANRDGRRDGEAEGGGGALLRVTREVVSAARDKRSVFSPFHPVPPWPFRQGGGDGDGRGKQPLLYFSVEGGHASRLLLSRYTYISCCAFRSP